MPMLKRVRDFFARPTADAHVPEKPPVLGRGGEHQQHPVAQYVRALLLELARGRGAVALTPDHPLPAYGGGGAAQAPSYEQVTNRLKVLAGIPPMHLPEPLDTKFTHTTHLGNFEIRVQFDEGATKSCRLTAAKQ